MRLADFICVGAQKAGTTWLYVQLSNHPQIFMKNKELNHFNSSDDVTSYAQHFEDASPLQRCGDISPNYAAFADLSTRVYATCPDAVILHLLRDPADRAYSQWKMARHLGNISPEMTFIEAFRSNLQYIKRRGEYSVILKEYLSLYPLQSRSQVFWYDDIRRQPAILLAQIMEFIGVDPSWRSPHLEDVVWPSLQSGVVDPDHALEVRRYYQPFDDELRALLGVEHLPWDKK
jgi:hypothetical protein